MTTNTKPALVYIRANSEHFKRDQERFIGQQVTGSNFTVVETVRDISSGASDLSRPGLQELFRTLQSQSNIQDIIVASPSRISRRKTDVMLVVKRLAEMGIEVHYAEDGLGSTDTAAELARFLRVTERRMHGERIRLAKEHRRTRRKVM